MFLLMKLRSNPYTVGFDFLFVCLRTIVKRFRHLIVHFIPGFLMNSFDFSNETMGLRTMFIRISRRLRINLLKPTKLHQIILVVGRSRQRLRFLSMIMPVL